MKYIQYASGCRVVTSDAVADEVIEYAAALAMSARADVVDIPSAAHRGPVRLLLGPAIPISVVPAPDDAVQPEDPGLVAELQRRTAAVRAGIRSHELPF